MPQLPYSSQGRLSFAWLRRALWLTFFCLNASFTLRAGEFPVSFTDIPRPVVLQIPVGFEPAVTGAAKARRERLLDFYRLNPAYKGRYEDVFVRNWLVDNPMPQIICSTLGAVRHAQGSITAKDWDGIRKEALSSISSKEIATIRSQFRPNIEANSPVQLHTSDELLWLEKQQDPTSVVVLANMTSTIDGRSVKVFSARKIIYHEGYLVTVDVVLDATQADALASLKEYVESIKVSRI